MNDEEEVALAMMGLLGVTFLKMISDILKGSTRRKQKCKGCGKYMREGKYCPDCFIFQDEEGHEVDITGKKKPEE